MRVRCATTIAAPFRGDPGRGLRERGVPHRRREPRRRVAFFYIYFVLVGTANAAPPVGGSRRCPGRAEGAGAGGSGA